MIRLSATARAQVTSLTAHFRRLERPEALQNLRRSLARAAERIATPNAPMLPAPRPYPDLARPDWQWLKQGPYWFAWSLHDGTAIIQVVFYETSNILGRVGE